MRVHGFQTWVALPKVSEEAAPTFFHHGKDALPVITGDGATVRLAVGSLYGERAPVSTFSEMFFADVVLDAGAKLRSTLRTRNARPIFRRAPSRSAAIRLRRTG